jgi:23S rRNA pseudouridine2605 synthase
VNNFYKPEGEKRNPNFSSRGSNSTNFNDRSNNNRNYRDSKPYREPQPNLPKKVKVISKITLVKLLNKSKIASHRIAKKLVQVGNVKVNNELISNPFKELTAKKDKVLLNDVEIHIYKRYFYYIFNKPINVELNENDVKFSEQFGFTKGWEFLFGKLRKSMQGLVLISNDPRFHSMSHSVNEELQMTYRVKINKILTDKKIKDFKKGIEISDKVKFIPTSIVIVNSSKKSQNFDITISSNLSFESIFKAFKTLKSEVTSIRRTQIGSINEKDVHPNEWRELTKEEFEEYKLHTFMRGELPPDPKPDRKLIVKAVIKPYDSSKKKFSDERPRRSYTRYQHNPSTENSTYSPRRSYDNTDQRVGNSNQRIRSSQNSDSSHREYGGYNQGKSNSGGYQQGRSNAGGFQQRSRTTQTDRFQPRNDKNQFGNQPRSENQDRGYQRDQQPRNSRFNDQQRSERSGYNDQQRNERGGYQYRDERRSTGAQQGSYKPRNEEGGYRPRNDSQNSGNFNSNYRGSNSSNSNRYNQSNNNNNYGDRANSNRYESDGVNRIDKNDNRSNFERNYNKDNNSSNRYPPQNEKNRYKPKNQGYSRGYNSSGISKDRGNTNFGSSTYGNPGVGGYNQFGNRNQGLKHRKSFDEENNKTDSNKLENE